MNKEEFDERIYRIYDIQKKIGQGAYGTVWKAYRKFNCRPLAIKKIRNAFQDEIIARRTYREINYLSAVKGHQNVVCLLNVHRALNNKDIYLVFEHMDIDLNEYLKSGYPLAESQIRFITYQVLCALKFIHSAHLIHRDVKPANILLNIQCRAKLADFGLARQVIEINECFDSLHTQENDPLTEYVATRWYRAPEVLTSDEKYTNAIDMWAIGCVIGEMFNGRPLFPGKTADEQLKLVLSKISAKIFPNKLEEIVSGPRDGVNLITNLLVMPSCLRLTADEALAHPYCYPYYTSKEKTAGQLRLPMPDRSYEEKDDYRRHIYSAMGRSNNTFRTR